MLQQPQPPAGHSKGGGAGGSIISILEVCEADFSKELAAVESTEADAVAAYDKMTQENKITKMTKDQDVKYKTAEHKGLDKAVAEHNGDKAGLQTELDAVLEYSGKLNSRCIAKPESYESRKAKREAEIAGLKDALQILESETAFVQRPHRLQTGVALVQTDVHHQKQAPEDELAKEMTHDLEMNFNKIAPFGKEDTAKELQDHAAKTQDTLVDAVENAEVAEIKRAVFRALTRLRAATIKEFDTIARLETQAID